MKTTIYTLLMCVWVLVVLSSCKKEEDEPITISTEDASDLIVNSLESDTWGISSQLKETILITDSYVDPAYCGLSGDSTLIKHYGGMAVQYDYTFNWNWTVNCTGPTVTSIDLNYHGSGNNGTSVMSSTFTSDGVFIMGGVESSVTEYIFNGTYTRNGDFSSKIRENHSCTSVLSLNFSNVKMSKTDYVFNSGTATVNLSCTTSDSQTFTFTGTLTFTGNQNCTITINGVTYTVQM